MSKPWASLSQVTTFYVVEVEVAVVGAKAIGLIAFGCDTDLRKGEVVSPLPISNPSESSPHVILTGGEAEIAIVITNSK